MSFFQKRFLCSDDKMQIIRRIGEGEMKSEVGKYFGISPSTVSTIWKFRHKLLEADVYGNVCKKIRRPKYFNLDKVMLQWIINQMSKNMPFTGSLIRSTAQKYALQMGITDFKASEGWLEKFKQRHNISKGKIHGDDGIEWPTLTIVKPEEMTFQEDADIINITPEIKMEPDEQASSSQLLNYLEPPTAQQALDAAKLLEQFLLHYENDAKIHQDMARICTKIQTKYFQDKKKEIIHPTMAHFLD